MYVKYYNLVINLIHSRLLIQKKYKDKSLTKSKQVTGVQTVVPENTRVLLT